MKRLNYGCANLGQGDVCTVLQVAHRPAEALALLGHHIGELFVHPVDNRNNGRVGVDCTFPGPLHRLGDTHADTIGQHLPRGYTPLG